jgi:hypothetical protein
MALVNGIPSTISGQTIPVNGIANNDLNARISELYNINSQNKNIPTYNFNHDNFFATIRNNIMLDKVLVNQNTIMDNQNKIMQKLGIGEKIDTKA